MKNIIIKNAEILIPTGAKWPNFKGARFEGCKIKSEDPRSVDVRDCFFYSCWIENVTLDFKDSRHSGFGCQEVTATGLIPNPKGIEPEDYRFR